MEENENVVVSPEEAVEGGAELQRTEQLCEEEVEQ